MTDEDIIKALGCCNTDVRENTCPKCAFYKEHRCSTLMLNAVSGLINRKNAEIERLQKSLEEAISCFNRMESLCKIKCKELEVAKSEAIKRR